LTQTYTSESITNKGLRSLRSKKCVICVAVELLQLLLEYTREVRQV
jgi:hypothetical protein